MGLRLLHLNLHGLFRSHDLELGRDADTGGQTLYVLELIKGLASRPEVEQVDLVTRLIHDRRVSADYAQPIERIASDSNILRFSFGPKRYLRKELLWPYLDDLADQLVSYLQKETVLPDWIHAHYADAGYVGSLVSRRLGIPLVFTAHSLGREKQRRLLAGGVDHVQIEQTYSISKRIDAEELALAHSSLVITSTAQEANQQYSRYDSFSPNQAEVVPPGVDSTRFHSVQIEKEYSQINELVAPFLREPSLPPLLAISRAVRRKNIPALVEAYGRSSILRQRNNLVLILGCREDPRQLEKQQREVLQQVFDLVDRYDLYGRVAYPKYHRRDQIPAIYRWAAHKKGLFVNPALTEPFGLTLLEAAASGLPIVATDDGGPRDILSRCENGLLTDVTDLDSLQDALEQAGSQVKKWKSWRDNGIEAVSRHFSWDAHVCNYLALMQQHLEVMPAKPSLICETKTFNLQISKLLLLDLDSTLEASQEEDLVSFSKKLDFLQKQNQTAIGIISGRSIKVARHRYAQLHLPKPNVWITRAGTEIYYGSNDSVDQFWESYISIDWNRNDIKKNLLDLDQQLNLQDQSQQGPFKVSYILKESRANVLSLVQKRLRQKCQAACAHLRCHWFLDVVPLRASRTEAIRHIALCWGLPLQNVMVIASQQGDAELVRGLTSTVIPAEHDSCLETFRSQQRVFFSSRSHAKSVFDGLTHYRFLPTR
ncbi:HAD family hydrolase [Prochlorococcus sp. MIT 1341]|uniref:HAD family hydrolase n=1 Tax=Prochlorococcus sp. MIT 1341 TaxID=3096221 RepID=UPI002A75A6CA|nr:HAD family hydrolase [Prochlorococcus sp. MIT 1341]